MVPLDVASAAADSLPRDQRTADIDGIVNLLTSGFRRQHHAQPRLLGASSQAPVGASHATRISKVRLSIQLQGHPGWCDPSKIFSSVLVNGEDKNSMQRFQLVRGARITKLCGDARFARAEVQTRNLFQHYACSSYAAHVGSAGVRAVLRRAVCVRSSARCAGRTALVSKRSRLILAPTKICRRPRSNCF